MKKLVLFILCFSSLGLLAQRYTSEVFSNVSVNQDVSFATNIDFLTSDFSDQQQVAADVTEIKTALAMGNPIPPKFYDPSDPASDVKVTELKMDVYEPAGDTVQNRPLVIYIHTGNFLPPQVNGGINGTKRDSSAIVMCQKLAKRGFVAIAPNYRLGWNPLSSSVAERRAQLLNAVYRAIHDMKELVRVTKADAANLGIDPTRITFMGEGSGAYVALAYSTLDKWAEVEIPKFINPQTGDSFVDSNLVGNIEGLGGNLNLYADNGQNTDISMCINLGGAMPDISWLEAGDPAMLSFHCVRDPYAPFDEGTVVVPTTGDDVVDVHGANVFIPKANNLGNNGAFASASFNDPITLAARARYGQTYSYIFQPPFDTISVSSNAEGLFPVLRPLQSSVFQNTGSPWQWWDPNGPIASSTEPTTGMTYHQLGLASNPNMSSSFGRTYQDTILGYATPRMVLALNLSNEGFSINSKFEVYPNPAGEALYLDITDRDVELDFYEIIDATGRSVMRGNLNQYQSKIATAELQTGMYILNLYTNQGKATSRFLKE